MTDIDNEVQISNDELIRDGLECLSDALEQFMAIEDNELAKAVEHGIYAILRLAEEVFDIC